MNRTQDLGAVQCRALRLMWRRTFGVPVVRSINGSEFRQLSGTRIRKTKCHSCTMCSTYGHSLERGVKLTRRMHGCRVWLPPSLRLGAKKWVKFYRCPSRSVSRPLQALLRTCQLWTILYQVHHTKQLSGFSCLYPNIPFYAAFSPHTVAS